MNTASAETARAFSVTTVALFKEIASSEAYPWSAGNEGMEKKMATIIGYIGTTIKIQLKVRKLSPSASCQHLLKLSLLGFGIGL